MAEKPKKHVMPDLSKMNLPSASQAAEAGGPWVTGIIALLVVLANVALMVGNARICCGVGQQLFGETSSTSAT